MAKDKARDEEMAFAPITEYRLVVGVFGIIFKEDSASAKRQLDLFVIQSKTARSAEVGASVTLFRNHEIIRQYHPPENLRA